MAKHPATQLTLKRLRADPQFLLVEVVEYFSAFPPPHGRRVDLFGLIDVLALGPGITLGVQCTSVGGVSARKRKIIDHPNTPLVLAAGWHLEIHGWEKKKNRWELGRFHRFELDRQQGAQDGNNEEEA
jgi:hypothetical protein